jgi:alanine racemase
MREALIRPAAISANVEKIRSMTPTPHTLVVVKADGYGHGALTAATAALEGGATWLGTADLTEALHLRHNGIAAPILAWLFGPDEDLAPAVEAGIDVGVSSLAQLQQVVSAGVPAHIHLKIDTGLGRSGADPREWETLFTATKAAVDSGALRLRGIFTHLSGTSPEADLKQGEHYRQGLQLAQVVGLEPDIRHVTASIGTSESPDLSHDMTRIGIAAYGIPLTPRYQQLGLTPAMRVSAQVVLTKRVAPGLGVGYGHTYRTTRETSLALIPMGYADGVPRHASNRGPLTINGQRFQVSGRISMDQFSVDIGDAQVREGDWAVLWGDPSQGEPTATEWADAADTIPYEILTRIGPRVPKVVR